MPILLKVLRARSILSGSHPLCVSHSWAWDGFLKA